jgi:uncharacterized protein DUF1376
VGAILQLDCTKHLTDTRIEGMSAEEERGYLRLLMFICNELARTGHGLKDDDEGFARLCKISLCAWRHRSGPVIKSCFVMRDGYWYPPPEIKVRIRQAAKKDKNVRPIKFAG